MGDYLAAAIDTSPGGIDAVCAMLTALGVNGFEIEDEADFLQFLEQNRQYWDYVDEELLESRKGVSRVRVYYGEDDETGLSALREELAALPGRVPETDLGPLRLTVSKVRSEDWENGWKQYYKPLAVGEKLYIVPEWERGAPVPEGRTAVYLEPGLTFGTGGHASTQLCLELLEKYVRPGCRVLDLGCGSGILSISALRLGASFAAACDIDTKAVGVAYGNADLNGVAMEDYIVCAGDILHDAMMASVLVTKLFDVVLANIVADVVIPLSGMAPGYLVPGGVFLASGVIDARAGEVAEAMEEAGLEVLERREKDGWMAFAARVGGLAE
ncbi:MAG TPA: 50S ribosomal protein L11 methyltransferase [Oscillospiraceae bacterium]|nr:50S ribosomal protein L11 methyltransferase [Oscillospiraceae bacterium]